MGCLRTQFSQSHWNIFVRTRTHTAETHRTFSVILPKRALLVKVDFVKSEVVFDQETAQSWVDFVVVEVVDGVHGTTAVMNGTFKL